MSKGHILGRWDSVAISIGVVIGVGIFRVPCDVAQCIQSPIWILIAWIIGGIVSLLGAVVYAELVALFPQSGGDYIYLREAYGKPIGFLFAWSELLITRTGAVAAIALIFGEYFCSLFALDKNFVRPLALAVIVLLTITNLKGLKQSSRLQNFLSYTKVAALVLIIGAGFFSFKPPASNFNFGDLGAFDLKMVLALGTALTPILWTYGGWRDNVFLAGDTEDAKKSVPFALVITCIVITLIYCAMNLLYLWFIPPETMKSSPLIAANLLTLIFGPLGAKILEALIVLYGLGVINGLLLTGTWLARAMSEDNPIFRVLEKTEESGMPVRALIFNGAWASVLLLLTGKFENLIYFTGLYVWIFFAMVSIAIIVFRIKQTGDSKGKSIVASFVIPIVVTSVSLLLAYSTIVGYPQESMIGTIIVLAGLPIFFLQKPILKMLSKDQ